MGNEHFIYGKRCSSHHEGRAATERREGDARDQEDILEQILCSIAVVNQADRLPDRLVAYHRGVLQFWGVLIQSNIKK